MLAQRWIATARSRPTRGGAEARQRTGADGGLRAGSRLRKAVAVEVIDARDGRLVVQAPDAYVRAARAHAAAEFGAWAVGREFALGELPARHAFLPRASRGYCCGWRRWKCWSDRNAVVSRICGWLAVGRASPPRVSHHIIKIL